MKRKPKNIAANPTDASPAESGPLQAWKVTPEVKRGVEVEAVGRGMQYGEFSKYVWQIYLENRPDMVMQDQDGGIRVVPIPRQQKIRDALDFHEAFSHLGKADLEALKTLGKNEPLLKTVLRMVKKQGRLRNENGVDGVT